MPDDVKRAREASDWLHERARAEQGAGLLHGGRFAEVADLLVNLAEEAETLRAERDAARANARRMGEVIDAMRAELDRLDRAGWQG